MSACDAFVENASLGVAPALRAVDCLAGETTAAAFGRLFGGQGSLAPALTILLTLYIAFFAISLLLGRSRLSISALSPRMLTLGLVLTFATSWVAYQGVMWNLATGAPDQIASVLTGSRGSATQIFADRIDMIFAAIGDIAQTANAGEQAKVAAAAQGAQSAVQAASSGTFTPANLMWISALLLLLGTVGVLVTARIALAVLLAVGPVFVVFALFSGTRGLTAGWLRGVVLTAVTPLFVVVGGGVVLELLVPVVASLGGVEGVNGRAALALFVIACVHVALMSMILKVAGTMVQAWQVFGLASSDRDGQGGGSAVPPLAPAQAIAPLLPSAAATAAAGGRAAAMVPATSVEVVAGSGSGSSGGGGSTSRTQITQVTGGAQAGLPPLPRSRARGIGSRFAAPQATGRAGGMHK